MYRVRRRKMASSSLGKARNHTVDSHIPKGYHGTSLVPTRLQFLGRFGEYLCGDSSFDALQILLSSCSPENTAGISLLGSTACQIRRNLPTSKKIYGLIRCIPMRISLSGLATASLTQRHSLLRKVQAERTILCFFTAL